jgi:hypothetical protein
MAALHVLGVGAGDEDHVAVHIRRHPQRNPRGRCSTAADIDATTFTIGPARVEELITPGLARDAGALVRADR